MRNQELKASALLARLLGADFDTLLEELDESLERSERELEKSRNKLARLKAQPDITVEGEVPSLEEIEEMIAESEREEALKRQASLERIRAQEAKRERRRKSINEAWRPTQKFTPFVPQESTKAEPENDDYEMEL